MERQHDLPTDRSMEVEQSPSHHSKPITIVEPTQFMIDKMAAHISFIEMEFLRNIDWQRQLLRQMGCQNCSSSRVRAAEKENCGGDGFKLNVNQQRQLKLFLGKILGERGQGLSLRQLIHEATALQQNKNGESSQYTFSPAKKQVQERLEFPVVQRVLTLNDFDESTQRHLTATPPSLPPRTPKAKPQRPKQSHPQNAFLTFTPQEPERMEHDWKSSDQKQMNKQKHQYWSTCRQMALGDSLGKRLFHEEEDKLMIYIEDNPQNEIAVESQVSLTLSSSNGQKKAHFADIHDFQREVKLQKPQQESIYLCLNDSLDESKKAMWCAKEQQNEIEGLCFREYPKRKIGKCVVKKENYFSYEESSTGKIRKMHDSFGEAYQEYYLGEGSKGKQACIYLYQNTKMKQISHR